MMNYKLLGEKLKECRKKQKLTQEKLAELIDISSQHISHIESGRTKLSMECFVALCSALDVTPNELLVYSVAMKDTTFANHEITQLFEDASPTELLVMLRSASAIKDALRQSDHVSSSPTAEQHCTSPYQR